MITLPGRPIAIIHEDYSKLALTLDNHIICISEYMELENKPISNVAFLQHVDNPVNVAIMHPNFRNKLLGIYENRLSLVDIPKGVNLGNFDFIKLNELPISIK